MDQSRTDLRDALLGGEQLGRNLQSSGDQHIVALRPNVLNDAEHALGNLFQRIYHVTRAARDGLGPYADRMTANLQNLEKLLQLVFDYVSPVELDIRAVDSARVIESLAAHVREHIVGEIEMPSCPQTPISADTRALGRSFQLLGLAFHNEFSSASRVAIEVLKEKGGGSVGFSVQAIGNRRCTQETQAALAWEVAARLIEIQGGELVKSTEAGGYTCTVVLPIAQQDDGAD